MPIEPERWYPSKVDWWLAVLLAVGPLACAAATVSTLLAGHGGFVAPLGGVLLIAGIYVGLIFPMRYGIGDDSLVVRHGLVRQRIPLAQITEVNPTRNPMSSPALSLDRLMIKFGAGYFKAAMISPQDKSGFLDELATRAKLVRDGDRLVRKG